MLWGIVEPPLMECASFFSLDDSIVVPIQPPEVSIASIWG